MKYLPLLGCLITVALGLLGAFAPRKAALLVGVERRAGPECPSCAPPMAAFFSAWA
jgi:hypothetical protein